MNIRRLLGWFLVLFVALALWQLFRGTLAPASDRFRRLQSQITRIRGLDLPRPVRVDDVTREGFREFLVRELDRELPPAKAREVARGYAKFGLIPRDFDLRGALVELLSDSTAAYYDPRTKELKILKEADAVSRTDTEILLKSGIDLQGSILVHELTHAAQDQAFDLSRMLDGSRNDDDRSAAVKSVVEGDASAVGWSYALGTGFDAAISLIDRAYETGELPGRAGKLPAFLRLSLTFPYGYGTEFVLAFVQAKGGSLKSVSELYRNLPLSTEQILHPEKYLGREDPPVRILLPDVPAILGEATVTRCLRDPRGEPPMSGSRPGIPSGTRTSFQKRTGRRFGQNTAGLPVRTPRTSRLPTDGSASSDAARTF